MAATGYTPISLYYSTTASAVPTAGNLANGELALNIADMKLYAKNSSGTVTLLASNASTTGVDSLSFGSTGLTPSTATTGAITVAGTLNVANGGTGLTSLTAGYIPFGAGTSAFGNSSNLFWDSANARLGIGTSSPVYKLDVVGNTRVNNTGTGSVLAIGDTASGTTSQVRMFGGATRYNFQIGVQTNVSNAFEITPSTAAEGTTFTTPAVVVLSSGNVGIGTNSPAYKLDVTGNGNFTSLLTLAKGSSQGLTIGDVATNSNSVLRMQGTSAGYNWQIANNLNAAGLEFTPSTATGGTTFTTPAMALTTTGLGIGVTSPSYKLDVNGVAQVSGLRQSYQTGLYTVDGALSNYSATNGVYLTGNASGWLALQASGSQATNILLYGPTEASLPNVITFKTNSTERLRFASNGAWGLAGANYGTSGQVLTSAGSGSAPTWSAVAGGSQAFVAFGSTGGF